MKASINDCSLRERTVITKAYRREGQKGQNAEIQKFSKIGATHRSLNQAFTLS